MTEVLPLPSSRREPVAEQRAAIDDRSRDLFLHAGAGSGKTAVLVERFCEAVCAEEGPDAETAVADVLAFTFTERAAAEMKRRVRAELRRRAAAEPEPERARRLRAAAREAEGAWISTIHAFCQRLLAAHPLAAGLDPRFAVLDEAAAGRLAAESFDAAFERFAAEPGDERIELAAAFRVRGLRELVVGAHAELRSRGEQPLLPPAREPDLAGTLARLHDAARDALGATDGATSGKAAEWRERIAAALALRPDASEEDVAACAFKSGARAFACEEVDRYRDALAAFECCVVEAAWRHHWERLRELVALFGEEYARRKEARSALDFEDLQLRARDLLRRRADLRRRLQARFRHVMVDEFQDTNELQLALVELLHREGGRPRNVLFTVGDEFQSIYSFRHADVDVFRRVRDELERAPDEDAGVRELLGSFRSRPEVLALVNALGRELLPGFRELTAAKLPDGAPRGAGPAVEVLVTEQEGWDDEPPVPGRSADEQAQRWRVEEAAFLAARLRELADAGYPRRDMVVLLRAFTHVEAYERALAEEGLEPYVVGGRGYWSDQQVTDLRHLLATVANPLDEVALLSTLASPACGASPDALWLLRRAAGARRVWTALRRFYGPPIEGGPEPDEDELAWRAAAAGWLRDVPAEDAATLRETCERLLALREEAAGLALEELVDRAATRLGYDLALLAMPGGRGRMANVRKLMRLAREFEAAEGRDLRAFLDFVDSERGGRSREGEAALAAEDHDGVRVMTVHAAKGLEFPLVAVADLGRDLGAGFPPALRMGAGDDGLRVGLRLARLGRRGARIFEYEALEREAERDAAEEERRVLHVAVTRAEERLILSGAAKRAKLGEPAPPLGPLMRHALPALGIGGELLDGLGEGEVAHVTVRAPRAREGLAVSSRPVRVAVRLKAPGRPGQQQAMAVPLGAEPRDESELREPLADPALGPPAGGAVAADVTRVSYSALSLYGRCAYRFYAERVLGLSPERPGAAAAVAAGDARRVEPTDELPAAATDDELDALASRYARGVVVHELLERSARTGWRAPDGDAAARLLRREGIEPSPREVERALALVAGFLASPLRASLAGARVLAEAPFAFRLGGVVVRGEIDLLADGDREAVVVDYKSDRLAGAEPAAQMGRYDVQRRIYALAALRHFGKPVRVAYVFLERPGDPVEARYGIADADALEAGLRQLAGGIERGEFPVTDAPHRALCLDCPARRRLCVHPPELTLRADAGVAS
jgi:ATP-dependent helicase/nuclease subunit A